MMAPGQIDLVATTVDLKRRCEHVAVALTAIAQIKDRIFPDPRSTFIGIVLAVHELEIAELTMRQAWWPSIP
jgi:hypothetical protein